MFRENDSKTMKKYFEFLQYSISAHFFPSFYSLSTNFLLKNSGEYGHFEVMQTTDQSPTLATKAIKKNH